MTWKVMPPVEVCDVMDFFIALEWPLSRGEAQKIASERLGWTIEVENGVSYLVNSVTGLNHPDVRTPDVEGRVYSMDFWVTDSTPPPTSESTAFLGDQFALLVREGTSRWGQQIMGRSKHASRASWDVSGGGQVRFSLSKRSVSASFSTPQCVESDRKAALYGV
ncbi:hypothetical protein GCM10027421_35960 [Microbacterium shaanxiense]